MSVVRRLQFADLGDVCVNVVAADVHRNHLFALLAKAHLSPLTLAAELGRLTEETASRKLAHVYAQSVIVGSDTPELEHNTPAQWEEWLLAHPVEFAAMRAVCENPDCFVEET